MIQGDVAHCKLSHFCCACLSALCSLTTWLFGRKTVIVGPQVLTDDVGVVRETFGACSGSGIAWLYPLVDGAPPVGWDEASRYLVLPVALVAAQFASSAIISPPIKVETPAFLRLRHQVQAGSVGVGMSAHQPQD